MGCHPSKRPNRIKVIIEGLSKSGKTVIFFKLTDHKDFTNPVTTIDFNSQTISHRDKNITIIDIGQQENIISSSINNFTNGIVFVIDSSTPKTLNQSRQLFQKLCSMEPFTDLPIMIYLNKQDKAVLTPKDIADTFNLKDYKRMIKIQSCNAVSGEGVKEGFQWLLKKMEEDEKK